MNRPHIAASRSTLRTGLTAVCLIFAVLVAVALWHVPGNGVRQARYDIFFRQTVHGLKVGSQVNYQGVRVGKVIRIAVWQRDPAYVQVRIAVKRETPVTSGTTATIQTGLIGISKIRLQGSGNGRIATARPGPEDLPIIRSEQTSSGKLLPRAPVLMNNLSNLTDRLNKLTNARARESMNGIAANSSRISADVSSSVSALEDTRRHLDITMGQAVKTTRAVQGTAETARSLSRRFTGLAHSDDGTTTALPSGPAFDPITRTADKLTDALPPIKRSITGIARNMDATKNSANEISGRMGDQDLGGRALPAYRHGK